MADLQLALNHSLTTGAGVWASPCHPAAADTNLHVWVPGRCDWPRRRGPNQSINPAHFLPPPLGQQLSLPSRMISDPRRTLHAPRACLRLFCCVSLPNPLMDQCKSPPFYYCGLEGQIVLLCVWVGEYMFLDSLRIGKMSENKLLALFDTLLFTLDSYPNEPPKHC